MFNLSNLLLVLFTLLIAMGCATTGKMEGAYRGPERFGKEEYDTAAPEVDLTKKVKVVLLTFRDERTKNPELDWTRQADIYSSSVGQPTEVRPEIEKAILAGLRRHPKIALVSPTTFLKSRDADVVLSGRVLKCQAERGAKTFGAETVIEITARDEFGNLFWKSPLRVQSFGKAEYRDTGFFDEIEPGRVGAAVTQSIEGVANELLQRRALWQAFTRAQAGPDRELAAEDLSAR